MAKELPYFKFEPNAWDNGNIQLCSRESKGLFIDLCATYWSRLGELPYALALQKHCNGNANALQELKDRQLFTIENENIIIEFLDEQLNEFQEVSVKRSKAANKRWGNASALQVQCKSNAIREEEKREEKKKEEDSLDEKTEILKIDKINLNPFQESFRSEWEKWIKYKKTQWKQTYKRIETQQTAFKHLLELSKGSPEMAKKIIDQSIGNLWKGLIELKTQQHGKENFGNHSKHQAGTHKVATDFTGEL